MSPMVKQHFFVVLQNEWIRDFQKFILDTTPSGLAVVVRSGEKYAVIFASSFQQDGKYGLPSIVATITSTCDISKLVYF